jgi:carbamoyltransferase
VQITLGISAFFHDSAAALIVDGDIVAAAQEERFNREKNTADFPIQAIEYCLQAGNIELKDVNAVVFYDKPFLKFERILETHYKNAPFGLATFLKAMPTWSDEKLFIKRRIRKQLKPLDRKISKTIPLYFSSHHLSHAASAFYPSPFQDAAILTIDAVGEWSTASIMHGKGEEIRPIREMNFPNSIGLLYSSFTYFLGFEVMQGEYKLMGLSPYGNAEAVQTKKMEELITTQLITLFEDGSIQLNRKYFNFEVGKTMIKASLWEDLFGIERRKAKDEIKQEHCNLALAIQHVTEQCIIAMAYTAKKDTGSRNLCMAGGVALNCVANGKLSELNIFDQIWVQPAAGDAGGALGAALAFHFSNNKRVIHRTDSMQQSLLGPELLDKEISSFLDKQHIKSRKFESTDERNAFVVGELIKGKVIGWAQGRLEFGPRALGGRSIIALPSIKGMQKTINLKVKFREDFRPFAPVMLKEEAEKYFGCNFSASYMQFVKKMKPEFRFDRPENYESLSIKEKLEVPRSKFQAITHVDFSSRLQVVSNEQHPFYKLLFKLREQTGDAMMINTSFNTNGEPIVNTIEEVYSCFMQTNISTLVAGNFIIQKEEE